MDTNVLYKYKHIGRKMFNTYLDAKMTDMEAFAGWKSLQFVTRIFSPKAKKIFGMFSPLVPLLLTTDHPEEQNRLTLCPQLPLKNIIPYNLLTFHS